MSCHATFPATHSQSRQHDATAAEVLPPEKLSLQICLFVFLFLWTPSFEANQISLMGFSLMSGTGVDGNAPYQAQELQITTLANPGIEILFKHILIFKHFLVHSL